MNLFRNRETETRLNLDLSNQVGQKKIIQVKSLALFFIFALTSEFAWSCVNDLRKGPSAFLASISGDGDLCKIAQRYKIASDKIRQAGIDPMMISNIRAPRFVRVSDWEQHKQRSKGFDPRYLYDRQGQDRGSVWLGWDRAAQYIDGLSTQALGLRSQGQFATLTMSAQIVAHTHNLALAPAERARSGNFRNDIGVGLHLKREQAPTVQEIQNAERNSIYNSSSSFLGIQNRVQILRWQNTVCYEDMTREQQSLIPQAREKELNLADIPQGEQPFRDAQGAVRKCGYFNYAEPSVMMDQIASLEKETRARTKSLFESQAMTTSNDPLYVAARAQRWFVSIHPFYGGNGRTSRLLMDYILQSYGLPAPILLNVDVDMMTPDNEWAQEVAKGILLTLRLTEECADRPRANYCVTH